MKTSRAIVQTGPRALELREFPLPEIDADSALLRIEACGICGSDVEQYTGTIPVRYPVIPGHEPLGTIEKIGDRAAKRWHVDVGDRVAVEAPIPCGHCRSCLLGRYHVCRGRGSMFAHGYV
ncbi:MAG: alcohol dehydrogenase catalytic domain-containing protein, partial [Candidatus Binatia bacterium]